MSYQLNHPKAYLGYAVALAVADTTDEAERLVEQYVTNGVSMARRGAEQLDFVTDGSLTSHGTWACTMALRWFDVDDHETVLEELDEMRGARSRFCDELEAFTTLSGLTFVIEDTTIAHLIVWLSERHEAGADDWDVATLVDELWTEHDCQQSDLDVFIRDDEHVHAYLFDDVGDDGPPAGASIDREALADSHAPTVSGRTPIYRSPTVHQLKTMLWHLGLLQQKGTQAKNIDPTESVWALEPGVAVEH